MARDDDQRGPRCRNSWRPFDEPLSQRDLQRQQRSPVRPPSTQEFHTMTRASQPNSVQSLAYHQRLMPGTTHAMRAPLVQAFKNPNLIPVVARRSQHNEIIPRAAGPEQEEKRAEEQLPQIWHPSIDDLIRRTAHDYDLIMNYERDAEGGQRWLPKDIAIIRDVGKHLHDDIFAIRRWQRIVAKRGDQDKTMMQQIKREVNFLKLLCERVQKAINRYEQKCEFELLREGVYAQDDDGRFYKPIGSQKYAADGGVLQDVARRRVETAKNDVLSRLYIHGQAVPSPEEHHGTTTAGLRGFEMPSEARGFPGRFPKRNFAVNITVQQRSLDNFNAGSARQSIPRSPDRILDGRVSKSHQSPLVGKRHDLSPRQHVLSPESDKPLGQSPLHKKARRYGRNNIYERDGVSRRQAKRDRVRTSDCNQIAGHLGKYALHY